MSVVTGRYASAGTLDGAWETAVNASPTVQAFRSLAEFLPAGNDIVQYWLAPHELWARSYAQWVALRLDDPAMLATVAGRVGTRGGGHWPLDEFIPIAEALDRLFRLKGQP